MPGTAVIIGAGPAGLTAAYELLQRTDIQPIVLEQDDFVGGISRTARYQGNRIDIGGHRFFSKVDRVMHWWLQMLPLQAGAEGEFNITYQNATRSLPGHAVGPDPEKVDEVMLVRSRKSRIYYNRKFFDYPLSLSLQTIGNLGLLRMARIGSSYAWSRLRPIRPEENLEQFLINRFGRQLYLTFFKSYTEKVWGVPCDQIKAEWGAQRIKGLSITKAVMNALAKPFRRSSIGQKGVETSLIERFLYPKFGPGQMWETCQQRIQERGAQVLMKHRLTSLRVEGKQIVEAVATNLETGQTVQIPATHVFSTMPMQHLVRALNHSAPPPVKSVSEGLIYRDFITVGLLVKKMKVTEPNEPHLGCPRDNWIYIQEPDVYLGRLQIFNNWSPYLVKDPNTVWLGLEYFCNEGDHLWSRTDEQMKQLGIEELAKIGMIDPQEVLDGCVIRVPKTYPAYFGAYDRFSDLRNWVDQFENLFLLGRNGMHRYNNQDHSMLTAMVAVDNLVAGHSRKDNIWSVNTEQEYHEEKK